VQYQADRSAHRTRTNANEFGGGGLPLRQSLGKLRRTFTLEPRYTACRRAVRIRTLRNMRRTYAARQGTNGVQVWWTLSPHAAPGRFGRPVRRSVPRSRRAALTGSSAHPERPAHGRVSGSIPRLRYTRCSAVSRSIGRSEIGQWSAAESRASTTLIHHITS